MSGDEKKRGEPSGKIDRRAQALRDNLHRRKLQARARSETGPKTIPGGDRRAPAIKPER